MGALAWGWIAAATWTVLANEHSALGFSFATRYSVFAALPSLAAYGFMRSRADRHAETTFVSSS